MTANSVWVRKKILRHDNMTINLIIWQKFHIILLENEGELEKSRIQKVSNKLN